MVLVPLSENGQRLHLDIGGALGNGLDLAENALEGTADDFHGDHLPLRHQNRAALHRQREIIGFAGGLVQPAGKNVVALFNRAVGPDLAVRIVDFNLKQAVIRFRYHLPELNLHRSGKGLVQHCRQLGVHIGDGIFLGHITGHQLHVAVDRVGIAADIAGRVARVSRNEALEMIAGTVSGDLWHGDASARRHLAGEEERTVIIHKGHGVHRRLLLGRLDLHMHRADDLPGFGSLGIGQRQGHIRFALRQALDEADILAVANPDRVDNGRIRHRHHNPVAQINGIDRGQHRVRMALDDAQAQRVDAHADLADVHTQHRVDAAIGNDDPGRALAPGPERDGIPIFADLNNARIRGANREVIQVVHVVFRRTGNDGYFRRIAHKHVHHAVRQGNGLHRVPDLHILTSANPGVVAVLDDEGGSLDIHAAFLQEGNLARSGVHRRHACVGAAPFDGDCVRGLALDAGHGLNRRARRRRGRHGDRHRGINDAHQHEAQDPGRIRI